MFSFIHQKMVRFGKDAETQEENPSPLRINWI